MRQFFSIIPSFTRTNNALFSNHFKYIGSFKRPFEIELNQDHQNVFREILQRNQPLSTDEWTKLRSDILSAERSISSVNIDATIIGYCVPNGQLELAQSYFHFLNQLNVQPNLATLGKYLKLFYNVSLVRSLTEMEKSEIEHLCQEILKTSPVLDSTTCENLISAISLTKPWQKSLDLIEMIKITAQPSSLTYSIVIDKSFSENADDIAWQLLNEMINEGKRIPKCIAFLACIKNLQQKSKDIAFEQMNKLLNFIGQHEIIVSRIVVEEISKFFSEHGFVCSLTSMKNEGKCNSCKKYLEAIKLTEEEFNLLRSHFLDRVLIRKNIFIKSTPEEIERFEHFLEKTGPYDCIIDGLNVAFAGGRKPSAINRAKLVGSVLRYFNARGKRTLILGRKHMEKWPKGPMNFLRKHSNLFFTDDLSQDDPFLLYAAIKSGPHTDFCSKDLMRGHAFLLGSELKSIFRRWQLEHQYHFDKVNEFYDITVHEPIKFKNNAHSLNGEYCWHIPFREEFKPNAHETFELSKSWLCISTKPK